MNELFGSIQMAKIKVQYSRRSDFSDKKSYKSYLEWLKNCYNAVDGTFYDAINIITSQNFVHTVLPGGLNLSQIQ